MIKQPLEKYIKKHVIYSSSNGEPSRHWHSPKTYNGNDELIKVDNANNIICNYFSYKLFQRYMDIVIWKWK